VLPPPEMLLARAHEKFDGEGRLADEVARKVLATLLDRFAGWIRRERAAAAAERAGAEPAPAGAVS
jgi:hypothetical protein